MYLDLRTRHDHDGHKGYKARRARLLVSCGPVRIQSPERPGHAAGTNEPIDCWFIRVWEPEPPEGVERLEWVLYVDHEDRDAGRGASRGDGLRHPILDRGVP